MCVGLRHVCGARLGTPLAINSGGDYAASVASTLAAREKALQADVLERVAVAEDAHGARRARLNGYQHCLVGEEAVGVLAKRLEGFLQAAYYGLGHPEMERTAYQARRIAAFR